MNSMKVVSSYFPLFRHLPFICILLPLYFLCFLFIYSGPIFPSAVLSTFLSSLLLERLPVLSIRCVSISSSLFISLQLPTSLLHPLWPYLFLQSHHLAYIYFPSPLTVSLLYVALFLLQPGSSCLTSLRWPLPPLSFTSMLFFSACSAIECDFSSRSWAFPPWHQFVGYHDNLLSQVIYRSAWLPHNTSCVWTHFCCFSIYLCLCVNFVRNSYSQNLTWAICIQCVWLHFHLRPIHKTSLIVWGKVLGPKSICLH